MLIRVLKAFILPSLLIIGIVIFLLGEFGYSTVVGNPFVSIICGAMIVGGTFLFIVVALYDYQRINYEKRNKE